MDQAMGFCVDFFDRPRAFRFRNDPIRRRAALRSHPFLVPPEKVTLLKLGRGEILVNPKATTIVFVGVFPRDLAEPELVESRIRIELEAAGIEIRIHHGVIELRIDLPKLCPNLQRNPLRLVDEAIDLAPLVSGLLCREKPTHAVDPPDVGSVFSDLR